MTPSISVIIPVLNEAAGLAATVRAVRAQGPAEILVVDGGSSDGTAAAAWEADRFLQAPRGRAFQMNAGARQAAGDLLLFLHGDCLLDPDALETARQWLTRPGVAAGCFTLRVRAKCLLYRWIEACASARVRLSGISYGDQGLFVRRTDFFRLGGFPPLLFLEDVFFGRRLRGHGRVVLARPRIWVSPRRWQRAGLVRQTLRNWSLTALAAAGVSPAWLARFYPPVR